MPPKDTRPFVVVQTHPGQAEATAPYATLGDAEALAATVGRDGGGARLYWQRPSGHRDLLAAFGPDVTHDVTARGDRWACTCGRRGVKATGETTPGQSHLDLVQPSTDKD